MPIRYCIDDARRLVETTLEGVVTPEELRRHAEALTGDPRRSRPLDEIVDLSAAASGSVPAAVIRELAQFLRDRDRNTPGTRLAFVAPGDAAFGLARMFEVYREHPEVEIRVFRRHPDARRWLGVGG